MTQDKFFEQRRVGVVIPVGALRGEKSGGVGEFSDLAEFARLAAKMGIGLIQILPVNDTGYESSPYSALSAFALHPLYLRIADLPEAAEFTPKIDALTKRFDKNARFSHYDILQAKLELLREIYAAHEEAIAGKASLLKWIEKNPWIKPYAVFRRLKEANHERSWKEWGEYRNVTKQQIEMLWNDPVLKKEHLFWVWIQEALDNQFSKAAKAVAHEGILLEGDLPILINDDSCDVWAYPEFFHLDLSAGAPPDMYSPNGQNWGFPVYNWNALAKDKYTWWKRRLAVAEKYYKAYRIDHVLGFFRIWAASKQDLASSSLLGRFIPFIPVTARDLEEAGFDKGRIRWSSSPHIPTREVWDALSGIKDAAGKPDDAVIQKEAEKVFMQTLDRINSEELWLFKDTVKGEKDIKALDLHPFAQEYLIRAWRNRAFLEYEKGKFTPVWLYKETRAYMSFSHKEKEKIDALIEARKLESEKKWETHGKKLLTMLIESSSMLPCAEDLGDVPDCVPKVLGKLKILGLRVVRWARKWDKEGAPYIPFEEYPELSVCTLGVHDSSTVREWWETEADQAVFAGFIGEPSLANVYNPGVAKKILQKTASAASRFRVFQIQDLLHLSLKYYADDPASERINVPGSVTGFNWTYRLPVPIAELEKDEELIRAVKELAAIKPAEKKGTSKNKKKKSVS
ncbi:MAG: 4-alpha-glucanotransferase [Treponema sp.]|jgi:4-alpha-glucanotransferase|nr:4-alpha-glucanotransferase [Treponema sp.]